MSEGEVDMIFARVLATPDARPLIDYLKSEGRHLDFVEESHIRISRARDVWATSFRDDR